MSNTKSYKDLILNKKNGIILFVYLAMLGGCAFIRPVMTLLLTLFISIALFVGILYVDSAKFKRGSFMSFALLEKIADDSPFEIPLEIMNKMCFMAIITLFGMSLPGIMTTMIEKAKCQGKLASKSLSHQMDNFGNQMDNFGNQMDNFGDQMNDFSDQSYDY